MTRDKQKKIVIVGYYGKGNFGDQLMLRNLLESLQPHQVTVVAYDEVSFSFPGLPHKIVYNSKRSPRSRLTFLARLLPELVSADLVFWGGGTCFYDNVSGGRGALLGVLKMFLLSRLLCVKVGFAGIGIGELVHGWNVAITRFLMKHCDLVSLRDMQSYEYVKKINPAARLAEDIAFLEPAKNPESRRSPEKKAVFCGMSHANRHGADDVLALGVAHALDCLAEAGYLIEMVPMHLGKDADDNDFHRKVLPLMRHQSKASIVRIGGMDQLESTWDVIRSVELVVSMRLHGIIAGVIAGKPIIAISDSRKIISFLADSGLGECRMSLSDLCSTPSEILDRINPHMCRQYMTSQRLQQAKINIELIEETLCSP